MPPIDDDAARIPVTALLVFLWHLLLVRRLFVRHDPEAMPANS